MTYQILHHRDYIELCDEHGCTIETGDHNEYNDLMKLKLKLESSVFVEPKHEVSYLYAPFRYITSNGSRIKVPTREYVRVLSKLTDREISQLQKKYLIKDLKILNTAV